MRELRKTKIVCTIGPTCSDEKTIEQMIKNGMNVARFNFSHGTHELHSDLIDLVRRKSKELNIDVAILIDTKGPEVRTGKYLKDDKKIVFEKGHKLKIVNYEVPCSKDILEIDYKNLYNEIKPGHRIYIADGTIELVVDSIEGETINTTVVIGNPVGIGSRKNVNVPDIKINLPLITHKDEEDIQFAIEKKADFLAASFIRSAKSVKKIRDILDKANSKIHIISKIESREGFDNIDDIIAHSDGIMVARGDLGVQTSAEEIPIIQKKIIYKANMAGKPVITATQMLESMTENTRPTRAESTDVANAVLDGTDAVMLSGETANGINPPAVVAMMRKICEVTEKSEEYSEILEKKSKVELEEMGVEDAMCFASRRLATKIGADAIITPTKSGNTARLIKKYGPYQPIVAVTSEEHTVKQLQLVSNVYPIKTYLKEKTDDMVNDCIDLTSKNGFLESGSKCVMVAGVPVHSKNTVNLIKVYIKGSIIGTGKVINKGIAIGTMVKIRSAEEAHSITDLPEECILVVPKIDHYNEHLLAKVKGVVSQGPILQNPVTKESSMISIETIKRKYPDLVIITEVENCFDTYEGGYRVTLDGYQGVVYEGNNELISKANE